MFAELLVQIMVMI